LGRLPTRGKEQLKLVTVVIPCYNSGCTLVQTVEAVKAQTYKNIEIIVVDDGSNDELTTAVIASLKGVRKLRQENLGLPAARNAGFCAARGEYVFPLDADDWLDEDAIAQLFAVLEADSRLAYAYSYIQLEGESLGVLKKSYNFFEQLFLNQMPYAILIRRSVWNVIGGYDETMVKGYEDWEFNIRLGGNGYHGVVVKRPLLHYRVSSAGMLLSQSSKLHGDLWGDIQVRNKSSYSFLNLVKLWWAWRSRASTYPLSLYFVWLLIYRVVPRQIFAFLFRNLKKYSHSSRVTKREKNIE
jgi:glycosyltransferase involved in cell wall biosynthesis